MTDLPTQMSVARFNETAIDCTCSQLELGQRSGASSSPGHRTVSASARTLPRWVGVGRNKRLWARHSRAGGLEGGLEYIKPTPLLSVGSWEHSAGRGARQGLSWWRPVTQL